MATVIVRRTETFWSPCKYHKLVYVSGPTGVPKGSTQLYNNVVAGVLYYCDFNNRIVCIVGPNCNNLFVMCGMENVRNCFPINSY